MQHAPETQDLVISRPGYTLPSTIALPASDGAAPCVVFFAGSGPTDRDWTSPLLPGTNGSGAQLALALQARGVGSIRFDKVGSGVNMPKSNAPADLKMLEVLSLAHYVDEAVAAFDELARRDRCGTIFLLGHSEGSIHASSAAIAKQADPRFGGLISLSGPSRSILDTAIEQIRAIRIKAGADAAVVDKALEDFRAAMLRAGRTGARSVRAPRGRGPVAGDALAAATAGRARVDLRGPARGAARLSRSRPRGLGRQRRPGARVRCGRIFAALGSDARDKARVTIADANHVYKTETRAPSTISQSRDRRRLRRRRPRARRWPRRRDRGLRLDPLRAELPQRAIGYPDSCCPALEARVSTRVHCESRT